MAKLQCNFPITLDTLDTDRIAGQDIFSNTMDVVETAITKMQAEMRRVTSKTATCTLTSSEGGLVKVSCAVTPYTIYLPTAVGNAGLKYLLIKTDDNTNLITIDADGTETINGALTATILNAQWKYLVIESDNVNWLICQPTIYDSILFNTNYSDEQVTGRLQWNNTDGTLEIGMKGNTVNLQVGQEMLTRVVNKTGVQIDDGKPVYVNSMLGNRPTIALAKADSRTTMDTLIGLATEDIADNAEGYITLIGLVRDVNTDSWNVGDILYVSPTTAGLLTTTRPTSPNIVGAVGSVFVKHATQGIIGVKITIHPTIVQLSDTPEDYTGAANKFLQVNSTPDGIIFDTIQMSDISDLTFGIADTNKVQINSASVANGEYAKFTASGLESKSFSEIRIDLGLVIGTNVLAEQTIGIANDNLIEIDDADAAVNDYCRLTANGIVGRSYAEVKTDLSLNNVENTALSSWAGTSSIVTIGTITTGVWSGTALVIGKLPTAVVSNADITHVPTCDNVYDFCETTQNYMRNLLEDTQPELGAELDCGAHTIGFTQQSTTGDGTTTIDWKLGNKFKFTFGAQNNTFTFTAPTNPCNLMLVLIQDGTGSRTATFPATVKWAAGTAPTLTTTANGIDVVSLYWDGTNYLGVASLAFAVPA